MATIHDPLNPSSAEIRVLTVLPGKASDSLVCTFETVSLDTQPEYDALSYVWGDGSVKKPISINEPKHAMLGVVDILTQPYWKRMWTFQEYHLAKMVPRVIYNNLEISIVTLVQVTFPLLQEILVGVAGPPIDQVPLGPLEEIPTHG